MSEVDMQLCCGHPAADHDPDMGCLNGWTDRDKGCTCEPSAKASRPVGIVDLLAAAMAADGSTGFRRRAGGHDGRWRRNR